MLSSLLPNSGGSRLVAFDHCRVPLKHFSFVRRSDPVARLHQIALEVDPLNPGPVSVWDRLAAYALYWINSLRQVRHYHAVFGRHVQAAHGVSHFRQLRELWHCMWRNNQCARHYYWRKLFQIDDRGAWLDNLEHRQVNTLLEHFNRYVPSTQLSRKTEFAAHCAANGLPTPQNLAVWETGGRLTSARPDDPRADVFVKPVADFGSEGVMAIPFDAASERYRLGTRLLKWSDLLDEIGTTHTKRMGCLLQRRLRNSAPAAVYGNDDICNLRIVTAKPMNGEICPIAAVLRIPSSFTTQGHDRNVLLSSIDVRTGRMGVGVFRNIAMPQFTNHPDTGYPIADRPLPHWREMLDLVVRAHRTCDWMPFVGWDVVDSDQGLMLLEANSNWGGDSAQLPGAPALGQTRFPEIYLQWYEHLRVARPAVRSTSPESGPSIELADQHI